MELINRAIQIIHGYSIGMARYREQNDNNLTRTSIILKLLSAIYDEFREYMHDLLNFRFINAFLELNDMFHTIVVGLLMFFLPYSITKKTYIWYLVFFWSGIFTPTKHSLRYLKYGCIRSLNHCRINDHNCINNNLTRKKRHQ